MKNILGLDLGPNSIGFAVVRCAETENDGTIERKLEAIETANSRIIPMDAATMGDFANGNSISQTKERTEYRGNRRLREREILRRSRLHRVLDILGWLPKHYADQLDRHGNIIKGTEPKLAWRKSEVGKYEFIFQSAYEEMLQDFGNINVPYDWTVFYLRKKALSKPVSNQELSWILLNFNQKRGYYQLRSKDDEVSESKRDEYIRLKVISVVPSDNLNVKRQMYKVCLENGDVFERSGEMSLNLVGEELDFIVTYDINPDGSYKLDKEGNLKRKYRLPKEEDWSLLKVKTEHEISESGKTVGAFIYDSLLKNHNQKIRGKLVRTIERKFYKDELRQILIKQKAFNPELNDSELYAKCIEELYPNNEAHRRNICKKDFTYLFIDDIIFYQRPLKSKRSLINDCPFESYTFIDKKTGTKSVAHPKCIAKSNPLFLEFRLWKFILSLRIYRRESDVDVTSDFLTSPDVYASLFEWLNDKKEVDQKTLLGYFGIKKPKGSDQIPFRWNYVEDKIYPCNETRSQIQSFLKKAGEKSTFLTSELEMDLWHILYSVEDKEEIKKALRSFAEKNGLGESFVECFKRFPAFSKEYGSYSAKAIKKILPLMRTGKFWKADAIDLSTTERIKKIIAGEYDSSINDRIRGKLAGVTSIEQFQGLPDWLACYIVYGRHSELYDACKWNTPDDIDRFLKEFKQYSLRNPIVEEVILETLRTVRDIWKQVGHIDEIHVELGREMKNTAEKRKKETERILENENTNLRIRAILGEFMKPDMGIDDVRPYSISHQELLKIYEDYALNSCERYDSFSGSFINDQGPTEDIINILKKFREKDANKRPSHNDIVKYKLWLDQRYRSPYTGKMIPLSRLFTSEYEIEHIIPQSRFFDNSFSNKIICESAVNKLKDNATGMEFINTHGGEIVELGFGKTVSVLRKDEYEALVKKNYSGKTQRSKLKHLLADEIPEEFINRQLNDSRYISKYVLSLLSNIVREKNKDGEYEQEALSKNVIPITGQITDMLKKSWGVNDVWSRIILPRFERMNEITGSQTFTSVNSEGHIIPAIPDELRRGFQFKRLDHRHHALDAIVIACATRDHVNLLNNTHARDNIGLRHDLMRKLCICEEKEYIKEGKLIKRFVPTRDFKLPWPGFAKDVEKTIDEAIVSFKQNIRIINRTTNYYVHAIDGHKESVRQPSNNNWAIRQPLHKDTIYGEVNLRITKSVSLAAAVQSPEKIVNKDFKLFILEQLQKGYDEKTIKKILKQGENNIWSDINPNKILVYCYSKEAGIHYYATRQPVDMSFTEKKIKQHVSDTGVQKIMLAHLQMNNDDPKVAFSPDGIALMNKEILNLNGGRKHKPILKVRFYEEGNKTQVGKDGNKKSKFAEAAKGTNLYFAVYKLEGNKRRFESIPLNVVIDRLKNGFSPVPDTDSKGNKLLFYLSPGDLVYVPRLEEKDVIEWNNLDRSRIYKMVSCTDAECLFLPHSVASIIMDKVEFEKMNKIGRALSGEMIKDTCVPIKVDRLGNLIKDIW